MPKQPRAMYSSGTTRASFESKMSNPAFTVSILRFRVTARRPYRKSSSAAGKLRIWERLSGSLARRLPVERTKSGLRVHNPNLWWGRVLLMDDDAVHLVTVVGQTA